MCEEKDMYHIAIVEDEDVFSTQLQEYIAQYQEENNVSFKVSVFHAWRPDKAMYLEKTEYPADDRALEKIVKGISYDNAVRYFGFRL